MWSCKREIPIAVCAGSRTLNFLYGNACTNQTFAGGGISYLTPFELNVQLEYLYNQAAENSTLNSFTDFYYRNLSVRDLSFAPHTFFANLSYPFTPLFSGGLAAMFFPKLNGFFAGPSLDLSLRNNLDLSLIVQHFAIELQSGSVQKATLGFLRVKWSF